METDWIVPHSVTLEAILGIYEAAYMDVSLNEDDNQICIREELSARVFLSGSNERLQIVAYYNIHDDAQRIDRLELVNRINERFVLIRAGIDDEGDLWFDYTILLKGGITKKAIVQATRIFLMLVPRAVQDCDEDNIVA